MPGAVVIATDGSKHASDAVALGGELAAKFGADAVLVHVLPSALSASVAHGLVALDRLPAEAREEIERLETLERQARTFVEAITPNLLVSHATVEAIGTLILDDAEALAKNRGATRVRRVMVSGDPAACILDAARTHQARFIVMGRRGLGRLAGLLIGSVSQKVNQLAECTCVTVH